MIYVIRNMQDGRIVDTTTDAGSADYYANCGYRLESQPDATDAERAVVRALKAWLLAHYEQGADEIYETVSTGQHVVALREKSLDTYKSELRAHWEVYRAYADDIRGA